MRSDWSRVYKSHILLDRVIALTKAEHVFLSYNNAGDMSKEYIEAVFKRYGVEGTYECVKIPYKKYENWKSNNHDMHFEYLFYIKKKPTSEVVYESPLNYIGSKAKVVNDIRANLISNFDTFVDLFGGGMNVGANIACEKIVYNDINHIVKDLIESFRKYDTYEYIVYVKKFIEKHRLEKGNKETYLEARAYYNSLPIEKRDIRMLFAIILYSFQQQIRFNSKLEYNNPAGIRWFNDCILAKLISFSRILKDREVTFESVDFLEIESCVPFNEKTLVYLDPPYMLTTGSYNDGKRGFKGWDTSLEKELFNFIDGLSERNIPCILSYVYEHKGKTNTNLKQWVEKTDIIVFLSVMWLEYPVNLERRC